MTEFEGHPARDGSRGSRARLLAGGSIALALLVVLLVLSSNGASKDSYTVPPAGPPAAKPKPPASSNSGDGSAAKPTDAVGSTVSTGSTGPVGKTYKIKSGDSIDVIAEKTGVSTDQLLELNPDVDPRTLQPGDRLKLQ